MGSLFKQETPPPPPAPPMTLVRDEVNNVEQVPVKNADGSVTYVTRRIPLSAEEQKERDTLDAIMKETLADINRLSQGDYTPDAATQKRLDAWSATRRDVLDDTFSERTRQEENTLARRGLQDSSAGADVRRQRRLDRQDANVAMQREREQLVSDLRNDDIARQQNLYNLAASQEDSTLAREARAASQGQRLVAQQDRFRQSSLLDYYNTQLRRSLQPSTDVLASLCRCSRAVFREWYWSVIKFVIMKE